MGRSYIALALLLPTVATEHKKAAMLRAAEKLADHHWYALDNVDAVAANVPGLVVVS